MEIDHSWCWKEFRVSRWETRGKLCPLPNKILSWMRLFTCTIYSLLLLRTGSRMYMEVQCPSLTWLTRNGIHWSRWVSECKTFLPRGSSSKSGDWRAIPSLSPRSCARKYNCFQSEAIGDHQLGERWILPTFLDINQTFYFPGNELSSANSRYWGNWMEKATQSETRRTRLPSICRLVHGMDEDKI